MPLADVFSLLVLGQGKSGLDVARWALAHPERVSAVTVYGGGTSEPNDATRVLEAAGASFVYGTEQVEGAYDVCVTCPGISEFSGFFKAGREHAAQIMGEPEFAYRLSPDNWIAITGTNGKTTTTSMLAWILKEAGLEPGFLIGGVPQWSPRSASLGRVAPMSPFVIEADEYDTAFFDKRSKFVHYRPRTAILNNLEYDHADIFENLAAIEKQFHHLVRIMPSEGLVVANGRCEALDRVLAKGCWSALERFDSQDGWSLSDDGEAAFEGRSFGRLQLGMPGRYNELNALAAVAAARSVAVPPEKSLEALAAFAQDGGQGR